MLPAPRLLFVLLEKLCPIPAELRTRCCPLLFVQGMGQLSPANSSGKLMRKCENSSGGCPRSSCSHQ